MSAEPQEQALEHSLPPWHGFRSRREGGAMGSQNLCPEPLPPTPPPGPHPAGAWLRRTLCISFAYRDFFFPSLINAPALGSSFAESVFGAQCVSLGIN